MGHVVGGWEYVWAAYGITWVTLVVYGVNLVLKRVKEHT
jgi:heme exporter protein D